MAVLFILLVQVSVAGTWRGEVKTSAPPSTPVTITFEVNGNELSGTVKTHLIFQTLERSIKGTIEGNKISFKEQPIARGRELTPRTDALNSYTGSIDGDELVLTRTRYKEESKSGTRVTVIDKPGPAETLDKTNLDPPPATLTLKRAK